MHDGAKLSGRYVRDIDASHGRIELRRVVDESSCIIGSVHAKTDRLPVPRPEPDSGRRAGSCIGTAWPLVHVSSLRSLALMASINRWREGDDSSVSWDVRIGIGGSSMRRLRGATTDDMQTVTKAIGCRTRRSGKKRY